MHSISLTFLSAHSPPPSSPSPSHLVSGSLSCLIGSQPLSSSWKEVSLRSLCMPSWVSMRMSCLLFALGFPVSITANLRYEFFLTLDFDWDFLSGKKRFRWPLVKYSFLTIFCLPLIIHCRYFISPIDIFCWQLLSECKSCDLLWNFEEGALNEYWYTVPLLLIPTSMTDPSVCLDLIS